jgi:hypothetical protein
MHAFRTVIEEIVEGFVEGFSTGLGLFAWCQRRKCVPRELQPTQ